MKPRTRTLKLCGPMAATPGVYSSHTGKATRTYAPFYLVRDEAYSMYAQHG